MDDERGRILEEAAELDHIWGVDHMGAKSYQVFWEESAAITKCSGKRARR
jgi:hypothetical protein